MVMQQSISTNQKACLGELASRVALGFYCLQKPIMSARFPLLYIQCLFRVKIPEWIKVSNCFWALRQICWDNNNNNKHSAQCANRCWLWRRASQACCHKPNWQRQHLGAIAYTWYTCDLIQLAKVTVHYSLPLTRRCYLYSICATSFTTA